MYIILLFLFFLLFCCIYVIIRNNKVYKFYNLLISMAYEYNNRRIDDGTYRETESAYLWFSK